MGQTPIIPASGPPPIQASETGTAGAVGVTERGPAQAVAIANFAEFTQVFGAAIAEPVATLRDRWALNQTDGGQWWRFALSVQGYFENGGRRMYVVRVAQADLNLLTVDDFCAAIGMLQQVRDVALCLAPGMWSARIHDALISQCTGSGDRMAILDAPEGLDVAGVLSFRRRFNSSVAALYYPCLMVADVLASRSVSLAPSGHIAGIYARVERERGVQKAPANELVKGITNLRTLFSSADQVRLNAEGVNTLRSFPGRGILVWGARTLSQERTEWKYVNVRRLFIFLERSIADGIAWAVFEPNDELLWSNIQRTVNDFMQSLWRRGMLIGSTPQQAYFVHCDRTTVTQNDLDNGRLTCVVGVAALRPAEFVILRIGQWTADHHDPP